MADQTDIGDEFELELQMAFSSRFSGLDILWRSVCRRGKTRIATAPATAIKQNNALI